MYMLCFGWIACCFPEPFLIFRSILSVSFDLLLSLTCLLIAGSDFFNFNLIFFSYPVPLLFVVSHCTWDCGSCHFFFSTSFSFDYDFFLTLYDGTESLHKLVILPSLHFKQMLRLVAASHHKTIYPRNKHESEINIASIDNELLGVCKLFINPTLYSIVA